MKSLILFVTCGFVCMLNLKCVDQHPVGHIEQEIIDESNRQPKASYTVNYAYGYPGTVFNLESTSNDPEGEKLTIEWIINGVKYSGRKVSVSFDRPGNYEVSLTIDDGVNHVEESDHLLVKSFPRLLVRLVSMHFGAEVGDGLNKEGQIYVVSQSVATSRSGKTEYQNGTFPNTPDKATWRVAPNSDIYFGPNSGWILFYGEVTYLLGISMVVADHDEKGFDWGGLISGIFKVGGTIVGAFYPMVGSVLSGLSQLSKLVSDAVTANGDDALVQVNEVHIPVNRWGIGESHSVSFHGGTIVNYSIEEAP